MLSRSAAGLYWMGRYLERASHLSRLLRQQTESLVDRPVRDIYFGWYRIYGALDRQPNPGALELHTDDAYTLADSYTLADDLTFEPTNPDSIRNCFTKGRDNARQMRHHISAEMWFSLNRSYLRLQALEIQHIWVTSPESFYVQTNADIDTLWGVTDATMYRDQGWRFVQLGRFLERAQLSRVPTGRADNRGVGLRRTGRHRLDDPAAPLLRLRGPTTGHTARRSIRNGSWICWSPTRSSLIPSAVRSPLPAGSWWPSAPDRIPTPPPRCGASPRTSGSWYAASGRAHTTASCCSIRYSPPAGGCTTWWPSPISSIPSRGRAPGPGRAALAAAERTGWRSDPADPLPHRARHTFRVPRPRVPLASCRSASDRGDDGVQRVQEFQVMTSPPAPLNMETDPFGNARHVLSLHREHRSLDIVATSTVVVDSSPSLSDRVGSDAWEALRSWSNDPAYWDYTRPTPAHRPTPALDTFVTALGMHRGGSSGSWPGADPLADLLDLCSALNDAFEYAPGVTAVNSPIDEILASRRGVCQDYAHVMIAIARSWGIPTRYVSGYLNIVGGTNRAGRRPDSATHAWVECRLPGRGLGGPRPDQPDRHRPQLRAHSHRPRLPRCTAYPRSDRGRRGIRAEGEGPDDPGPDPRLTGSGGDAVGQRPEHPDHPPVLPRSNRSRGFS